MFNPSRPEPGWRKKISVNFYFHTSLWCLKRFNESLKKRLWHRCFPMNVATFPRTPFLQNTSEGYFWKKDTFTASYVLNNDLLQTKNQGFLTLNQRNENPSSFIQSSKNWKSVSYYWWQVFKFTCMYSHNDKHNSVWIDLGIVCCFTKFWVIAVVIISK